MSVCWGQRREVGSPRSPEVSGWENRWEALPSKEMKSAGRGADVKRGGSCLSHAQHGLGAIGMFCDLGKSRNSSE